MAWSLSQSFVFTVIFFKSKMTGYIWLGLKSQNLSLNLRKFLYFIWKTFLCFNNFKNLFSGRKSHQNEDGFFFLSFFFFVYHAQVDTCDSGNSWLISFIRSTFWKISKKNNNKCIKINKINLTVHVTWTSFSPSLLLLIRRVLIPASCKQTWLCEKDESPCLSLLACMAHSPEGNFVKKKKKIKKTKTFLISKIKKKIFYSLIIQ